MLAHGLFGISLHPGVDGGVYLKTVVVYVVARAVGLAGLFNPAIERICGPRYGIVNILLGIPRRIIVLLRLFGREIAAQFLAEVGSKAVLVVHALEVECQRLGLQAFQFGLGEHIGLVHLLEHHVAAVAGALRLTHRVEIGRVLNHAYKRGCLQGIELPRLLVEVHFCRRFYANGVIEEVELVEIHLQNFLL